MRIEGVNYHLHWPKFKIGTSFFVPCLNDADARQRIETKMSRLGYATLIKLVVEDGIRGLRVWRIKR